MTASWQESFVACTLTEVLEHLPFALTQSKEYDAESVTSESCVGTTSDWPDEADQVHERSDGTQLPEATASNAMGSDIQYSLCGATTEVVIPEAPGSVPSPKTWTSRIELAAR